MFLLHGWWKGGIAKKEQCLAVRKKKTLPHRMSDGEFRRSAFPIIPRSGPSHQQLEHTVIKGGRRSF